MHIRKLILFSLLPGLLSCKKSLDVDLPASLVPTETAFSDDNMATATALGMYTHMMSNGSFASGGSGSTGASAGLSADELVTYNSTTADILQLEQNTLLPANGEILGIWTTAYRCLYDANIVIEGLNQSTGVSTSTKAQLQGEAFFVRAFCHFYLANLFGHVPLVNSTDYRQNAKAPRTAKDAVYTQIIQDLNTAISLLASSYTGPGKLRVNKAVAQAMLARVLLYKKDWTGAITHATAVLGNSSYQLPADLNTVFLGTSTEAIWQMSIPPTITRSTFEGSYFLIESVADLNFNRIILSPGFINQFEPGDKRYLNWVKSFNTGTETVYYPYKYKLRLSSASAPEYSTVIRLAEMYLIRAEARAQQNELPGAIEDMDMVRARAGLPLIAVTNPGISKENLLLAIEHERQVELFTEWGHRWLDLQRTGRASAVLAPLKGGNWQATDTLYPIPQTELNKNPFLAPQNDGY